MDGERQTAPRAEVNPDGRVVPWNDRFQAGPGAFLCRPFPPITVPITLPTARDDRVDRVSFHIMIQDSSKGGAVDTVCSGLHYIIGCLFNIVLPPSTAPPSDCTPL